MQASISEDDVSRIAAHPRFAQELSRLAAEFVDRYDAAPRLGRLLAGHRHWFLVQLGYALASAGRHDPADPGLTAARMTALVERYGIASRNTVTNFLAELAAYRFVAEIPNRQGRRSRPLGPTPIARAGMEGWLRSYLSLLDRLDGGSRMALVEADETLMDIAQGRAALMLATTDEWLNPPAQLRLFLDTDTAGLVLDHLFSRIGADNGADGAVPVGRINRSALARQFMISRSHLDRVLRRSTEAGLLLADGQGGLSLARPLIVANCRFQAVKLATLDRALADAAADSARKIPIPV